MASMALVIKKSIEIHLDFLKSLGLFERISSSFIRYPGFAGAPLTAKNETVILLVHGVLQNPSDIYI